MRSRCFVPVWWMLRLGRQCPLSTSFGQLAEDVIDLTREMDDYTRQIAVISAEEERIGTELALAARIQAYLDMGLSTRQIARRLRVCVPSLRRLRARGAAGGR